MRVADGLVLKTHLRIIQVTKGDLYIEMKNGAVL